MSESQLGLQFWSGALVMADQVRYIVYSVITEACTPIGQEKTCINQQVTNNTSASTGDAVLHPSLTS